MRNVPVSIDNRPKSLFWDTREPYDYLGIDRHHWFDYIVYGGEDHKTGQKQKTQKAYVRVWRRIRKIISEAQVGSRFKPTSEVMAGTTEEPLPPV